MIISTHQFVKTTQADWDTSINGIPENMKTTLFALKSYVQQHAVEIVDFPDPNTCKITVVWSNNDFNAFLTHANSITNYTQWLEDFRQVQADLGYTFTRTIEDIPD